MAINVVKSPAEFFSQSIDIAVSQTGLLLGQDLRVYLLNLLLDNIDPNKLLRASELPLSILLLRSWHENLEIRKGLLKHIGDYTLYVAGYFKESLNSGLVNRSYYVSMGSMAFANLASIIRPSNLSDMYTELSKRMPELVLLLENVRIISDDKN